MNANELADLMIQFDSSQVWEHAEEIATMLRQQQAEIEALKERLDQATQLGSAYAIRMGVAEGHTNTAIHDAILDLKGK